MARKSTGGEPPRKQLASMAARRTESSTRHLPSDNECMDDSVDIEEVITASDLDAAMHKLIGLQTFSGAWTLSEELLAIIGVSSTDVFLQGGGPESRATALAIAFLEHKAASKRDVWEMVVAKGRAWLGKQNGLDGQGAADDLIKQAATCL